MRGARLPYEAPKKGLSLTEPELAATQRHAADAADGRAGSATAAAGSVRDVVLMSALAR